jgi:hypothetical protein
MLGNDLWFKATLPVTGDLDRQFAELTLECLVAYAISGVTGGIGNGFMFAMPKVGFHLGLQCALNDSLGKLLEQAMLANQVFGFLITSHKLVN